MFSLKLNRLVPLGFVLWALVLSFGTPSLMPVDLFDEPIVDRISERNQITAVESLFRTPGIRKDRRNISKLSIKTRKRIRAWLKNNHISAGTIQCLMASDSKFSIKDFKRVKMVTEGLYDIFLLTIPEEVYTDPFRVKEFISAFAEQSAYSGKEAIKRWKSFTNYALFKVGQGIGECPKVLQGVPGIYTPEYAKTGIPGLDSLLNNEINDKSQATRLAHLISSRNLPAPEKDEYDAQLLKHRQVLTGESEPEISTFDRADITDLGRLFLQDLRHPNDINYPLENRRHILKDISRKIGRFVKTQTKYQRLTKVGHVSVTTAGSYQTPRSEGGRGTDTANAFFLWGGSIPMRTEIIRLINGTEILTVRNIEMFRTVRMNPKDPFKPPGFFHHRDAKTWLESEYNGIDSDVGLQLFVAATELSEPWISFRKEQLLFLPEKELILVHFFQEYGQERFRICHIMMAYLETQEEHPAIYDRVSSTLAFCLASRQDPGKRFSISQSAMHVRSKIIMIVQQYLDVGQLCAISEITGFHIGDLPVKSSAISEPGWKIRIVTRELWFVPLLLQPFAHVFRLALQAHPSARAGLSKSHNHYEWAKGFKGKPEELFDRETFHLLSADLEEATDHCDHRFSRDLLEGFAEGIGFQGPYIIFCIHLLTTRRLLYTPQGKDWLEPVLTRKGILMGDPGTKVVLTLYNLVAEYEAANRFLDRNNQLDLTRQVSIPWRNFAAAGDDHEAYGPIRYLRNIGQAHTVNGMKLSKEKYHILKRIGKFSEKLLYINKEVKLNLNLSSKHKYEEAIYVDSIKIRLLSVCQKGQLDDDTNPMIGKGKILYKEYHWAPPNCKVLWELAADRFFHKALAWGYIPNPKRYPIIKLPIEFGGLGLSKTGKLFPQDFDILEPWHRSAIAHLVMNKDVRILRILTKVHSDRYARGIEIDQSVEMLLDRLKTLGGQYGALCGPRTFQSQAVQFADAIIPLGFDDMAIGQKKTFIRSSGYIGLGEVRSLLVRENVFTKILSGDIKVRKGPHSGFPERLKKAEEQYNSLGLPPAELDQKIYSVEPYTEDSFIRREFVEGILRRTPMGDLNLRTPQDPILGDSEIRTSLIIEKIRGMDEWVLEVPLDEEQSLMWLRPKRSTN